MANASMRYRLIALFEAKQKATAKRIAQDENPSRRSEKINSERGTP
jgi:hypothetical protein